MEPELDPAEALALAKGARARLAARAATPAWYAPLYGLGCGGLVAGGGMRPPWSLIVIAVSLAWVFLLYGRWQRKSGLAVGGYRKGRTRTIALALVVALLGLTLAGFALRERMGFIWAPIVCGAVAAAIAAFASAAWDRAWRDQMIRDAR
jgi:hypothetical protein